MYRLSHDRKRVARALLLAGLLLPALLPARTSIELDRPWRTVAAVEDIWEDAACPDPAFDDSGWKTVSVPHNWDSYEGFRQLKHGNFHGVAWYRTRFTLPGDPREKRVFLYFEGVGSYATVWVNGRKVGSHAGGLTTFTIDVTEAVKASGGNTLAVKAEHPSGIRDLPWVCGGCEQAYGFSEGSQPFGIFRPAHVVMTNPLRIAPFGVHAWNGQDISGEQAVIHLRTEVANHSGTGREFNLRARLRDAAGKTLLRTEKEAFLEAGGSTVIELPDTVVKNPELWSPDRPYLYTIVTEIIENGTVTDSITTPFGIRWIDWPDLNGPPGEPLRINGEPFFINGVADYEHLLGGSHAFSAEQVRARAGQILAAGFNAFRDAHHPHNLRFNEIWDRKGILWWTQFGAHIWFDTDAFQDTYKELLRDWVKERRNSPSLFLYTLQNESKLPADFAAECAEIIREMDPTASIQRPVVTCNGGSGTDWDVPQNWSGTYGGNLFAYDEELVRQRMVGEYGAWRSLGYHSEGGFIEDGPLTEDRMAALMETKVRLGEEVRDQVVGHFAWPFTTHANPGRNSGSSGQQMRDGIREWDRIGPANNKGLITIWGEPLDVFYMYRSNYTDPATDPMVYIVSHTWPDRWVEPGLKDGIIVYSNAGEVELFNGYRGRSLGLRRRGPKGTHFRWDNALIENNVLYAEARLNGRTVATDIITLHHLPEDPGLAQWDANPPNLTAPLPDMHYLYRVNAGGEAYTDRNGNRWLADREYRDGDAWGCRSWAARFENLPPEFGSKREISDPVRGTADDPLFQSFRYGREQLAYRFSVPNGHYIVELYFTEPWYGTGGVADAAGWRLFDVAVNGRTVIDDLDLWQEAGRAGAVKKVVRTGVADGILEISFPEVRAGQAVISAIAIAAQTGVQGPREAEELLSIERAGSLEARAMTHADTGRQAYTDSGETLSFLPWELREAAWIQTSRMAGDDAFLKFRVHRDAEVFVALHPGVAEKPAWLDGWELSSLELRTSAMPDQSRTVYRRRFSSDAPVSLGPNGRDTNPMYMVLVKEFFPPPASQAINQFSVSNSLNPGQWKAFGNLQAGRRLYADEGSFISQFTSRLSDCDWVQGSNSDAANPEFTASFTVEDHTEVFVGLDTNCNERPEWMSGWIGTGWYVRTGAPEPRSFDLFKRRFRPGETVVLGPNCEQTDPGAVPSMYTVVVRTVRPDHFYNLRKQSATAAEWTFEVGVGDRYNLNFQYRSRSENPVTAQLDIISQRDGSVVCSDEIQIQPTARQKWTFSRNRTCDDINAGVYTLRLTGEDVRYLDFNQLQVE